MIPLLTQQTAEGLPLAREPAWDFSANRPIWRGGEPVMVTGAEAVLVWAWNALNTRRWAHDVFSAGYGLGLEALVGRPYTQEVREAEVLRLIREALTSPYITDVQQIKTDFQGSTLTVLICCTSVM